MSDKKAEGRTWDCSKCNDAKCRLTYEHDDHSAIPSLIEMGQCIHMSFQDAEWVLRQPRERLI